MAYTQKQVEDALRSLPGKRGQDIPEHIFDLIAPVAHGISKQVWGTAATPHQLQALFDGGAHDPQSVKAAFDAMPHPHAPSISVGEYPRYADAYSLYDQHKGETA